MDNSQIVNSRVNFSGVKFPSSGGWQKFKEFLTGWLNKRLIK